MKRVVFRYYGFQFFFSLLVWIPIFYEYQKRIGLTDGQIFGIQSIYYVVFCLLEIPTGYLADRWGHERCLKAGGLTLVASNLLPIFAQNYAGFLAHFLLIALSRSLISGASSAYLYDFLAQDGAGAEYKRIEGRARAYGLIGKVVCWSGVGALMQWHLTLPYWLTTLASAVSVGFAWSLPALARAPLAQNVSDQLWARMRTVGGFLMQSPILLLVMLQGVAIFVLSRLLQVNLFQPILGAKGFTVASYGLAMAFMTVFEAVGSGFPNWIRRHLSDLNAVYALTLIMATTLAIIPFGNAWVTLGCLGVFSLATGLAFPVQRQLLNDVIPDSHYRATLLSIESIIDRAVCAGVAALLGAAMGGDGLNRFLVTSAGVTVAVMAVLALATAFVGYSRQAKKVGSTEAMQ